jgi:hypothetical protein
MKLLLPILLLAALVAPQAQADEGISVLQDLKPMDSSDMSDRHGGASDKTFVWMNAESNTNQNNFGNTIGDVGSTGGVGNVTIGGSSMSTAILNTGNQVNISSSNTLNVYLH